MKRLSSANKWGATSATSSANGTDSSAGSVFGGAGHPVCFMLRKFVDDKYYVFNQRAQTFLHLGVSLANTSLRRMRGLLGRWSLRNNEGVWVIPSQGVHTVGLFFPIDVVYLDESRRVVHLIENLKPFRLAALRVRCNSVLELPIRSIYSSNTQVGDQLLILTPEQMQKYWERQRQISPIGSASPSRTEPGTVDAGERK